jgi:hypothetical protein
MTFELPPVCTIPAKPNLKRQVGKWLPQEKRKKKKKPIVMMKKCC